MGLPASRPATATEWRDAFLATPGATFVQSPDWYAAATPLMKGYTATAYRLDLPGGPAIVPLWEKRVGGWLGRLGLRREHDIQANASGLYAAWLRATPLDAAERGQVAAWLHKRSRLLAWRANPFQEVPLEWWPTLGPVEEESTYLIDLTKGPEALWSAYASGMRADVNRTKRAGVICRPASGPADWDSYVTLYEETLLRWAGQATNRYPREVFESLSRLPTPGCQLWVAELEGRMVAGAIHFYHDGHVLGWHLANRLGIQKLSPTKLLIHEVILDAQRRGFKVYDLNVSGGHAGPERWKQLMGSQPRPAPFVRREPSKMRQARLARKAAREVDATAKSAAQTASGGGADPGAEDEKPMA